MGRRKQPEGGPACPPLLRFAIDACLRLYTVRKAQTDPCFKKLLLHQLARQSAWRESAGPPSTCNALMFAEEARRRSIYWPASWLAQNAHL